MIPIICVDKNRGVLFNNRSCSKDKLLNEWILKYIGNSKLFIAPYSKELFTLAENIIIGDHYLDEAGENDYVFLEDGKMTEYMNKIDSFILCQWNREYPSDIKLEDSIFKQGWTSTVVDEIKGYSHEKITIEEWRRDVRTKK